jgi:hypothetical protein
MKSANDGNEKLMELLDTLRTYRVGTFAFALLETLLIIAVVANWDYLSTVAIWGEGYDMPNVANWLALVFGSLVLIPTAMGISDLVDEYFDIV